MLKAFLAFDLGAESGRAMLTRFDGRRVHEEEVHRFDNLPLRLPSGYHWNLTGLWAHLLEGLRKAGETARQQNLEIASLGVDTWGVDFGLVGQSGQLLGLPFAHRDERFQSAFAHALERVDRQTIYHATGIQFLAFNTLFQMLSQYASEPATLEHADRLVMIPDLLHYFFTGRMVNEATNASTTQMIDPYTGQWARDLVKQFGLPTQMLKPTTPAGTPIGPIRDEVAQTANVKPVQVTVPGTHDTASAVAAVPVSPDVGDDQWAYLSSGTWSLMGAELDKPLVNDATLAANFTNERGVGGKIRFLKNIAGLWLVQQVRADLAARGQRHDYAQLTVLANDAEPLGTLIDPSHEPFASPGGMLGKIDEFAARTDQPKPESAGQYTRCCLESLALAYRQALDKIDHLLERSTRVLHVVGGGGKNDLLNQMTADALNRPVIVGPYEATAVGNALTQAMGTGDVADLTHLRQIIRDSYEPITYEPKNAEGFAAQLERFGRLTGGA